MLSICCRNGGPYKLARMSREKGMVVWDAIVYSVACYLQYEQVGKERKKRDAGPDHKWSRDVFFLKTIMRIKWCKRNHKLYEELKIFLHGLNWIIKNISVSSFIGMEYKVPTYVSVSHAVPGCLARTTWPTLSMLPYEGDAGKKRQKEESRIEE